MDSRKRLFLHMTSGLGALNRILGLVWKNGFRSCSNRLRKRYLDLSVSWQSYSWIVAVSLDSSGNI